MTTVLYSHDGRGIGHVSRTAALAMGIKRIKPDEQVICITGYEGFNDLHPRNDIEWIKLPSYKTTVTKGKVWAKLSPAGYTKEESASIRSQIILASIKALKPDNIIVEYFPQGKMLEIRKTLLYLESNTNCNIYLGLRGVIADKNDDGYGDIFNQDNYTIIDKYYKKVFCYTDSNVFTYRKDEFNNNILSKIVNTGYVSRASEIDKITDLDNKPSYDKLVGLGCSVNAFEMIKMIINVKSKSFPGEKWAIFLGTALSRAGKEELRAYSKDIYNLDLIDFNDEFLAYLKSAKAIISHGGYNTITDTLFFRKPTIYIARDVPEKDQEIHLEYLKTAGIISNYLTETNLTEDLLENEIRNMSKREVSTNIDGSSNVAKAIFNL